MTPEQLPTCLPVLPRVADLLPGPEADPEGGGLAPSSKVLTARMFGQLATNWCWSALAQTVIQFRTGTLPTQHGIATSHVKLNGVICRPSGEDREIEDPNADCRTPNACTLHCNDQHRIRSVLIENNRFRDTIATDRVPTFQELKAEIDSDLPVACRVAWPSKAGHFVLVIGCTVDQGGTPRLHVLDPARNEGGAVIPVRIMTHQDFTTKYDLSGTTGKINFAYGVQ